VKKNQSYRLTILTLLLFIFSASQNMVFAKSKNDQFEMTNIKSILVKIADKKNMNLVFQPNIELRQDIYLKQPISSYLNKDGISALNEILTTLNLHAYQTHNSIHVVKLSQVKHLPADAYDNPKTSANDWVYTTQKVDKKLCVSYLVPMLRTLMSVNGHMSQNSYDNSLVLFGRKANITKIKDIITNLEKYADSGRGTCENAKKSKHS